MHNFGKKKFRISKARGLFIASTILVIAAFIFPYAKSSFPSSQVKLEQQATISFLNDDFPGGFSSKPIVSNFRRGFNFVIELPDNEVPLDPSLKGKAWQLANTSQILTLKEIREGRTTSFVRPLPLNTTGANGTIGESSPVCSPLCGRHGWGECKKGTRCVCPVFYDGIDCMKGIDLPKKGPLWKVEAKYVGDLTMNRRSLEGRKWIVGCIPEKLHEPDLGHRVLGTVTPRLLSSLPVRDPFSAGKVYENCAIVGSSGVSLHYAHGDEISQHDLVMRFNSAPRQGYEKHVGNKTTVRVTNVHNWGFFEHSSEMVLVPVRSRAALDALVRVRQHSQPRNRQANTLGISPDFIRYVASSFDFLPSVGLLGIFIALQRCNVVDLYGFHGYREQNISYHYYDSCARPTDEDRDRREYGVVNKLAKLGLLNWRDPCIQVCHDQKAKCANCLHHHNFQQLNLTSDPPECPACSFTKEGCKQKHHWAFRNKHSRSRHPRKNNLVPGGITDGGGEGNQKAEGTDIDNVQDNKNISTNNSSGKMGFKTRRGTEDGITVDEKSSKGKTARAEDKSTGEDVEEDATVEDTMIEEDEKEERKEETSKSKKKEDGMEQADKKEEGEIATEDDSEVLSIDTDDEDEYNRKVWPEFPGKKKKKINKPVEGEKANEEAEEIVEVMTFTQNESTQPAE